MKTLLVSRSSKKQGRNYRHGNARYGAFLETLETRNLMSLLGIAPNLPLTFFLGTTPGTLTYTAPVVPGGTGSFAVNAAPSLFVDQGGNPISVTDNGTGNAPVFHLGMTLDASGNIIAGSTTNTDVVITGYINDNGTIYDGTTLSHPLLTGKLVAFGSEAFPPNGTFDFRFSVTGGSLTTGAVNLFQGADIGVVLNPEQCTFTGSFATNFGALITKGNVGTINQLPVTIGDFVWNDLNADGIQNDGNTGIGGVKINLYSGSTLVDSTTTAANGSYLFTENPGTYTVTVDASNFATGGALAGFFASPTGQGTPATDSNANPSGTSPATLISGGSDLTVDFGFYKKVTIGDYVWNDLNADGIQNDGNTGIGGVKINLYSGSTLVDSTTTAANGSYLFTENPGTYTVKVDTTSAALAGFSASPTGAGTSATDSNANPSGTSPATLISGGSDLTVDFGYYKQQANISGLVFGDGKQNTPLDGIQQSGEAGIAGVQVKLVSAGTDGVFGTGDDVTVASTTTLSTGTYNFSNVQAGTYRIVEGSAPSGYIHITEIAGSTGGTIGDHYIQTTVALGNNSSGNNFTEFKPYDGNTGAASISSNFNGTAIAFNPVGQDNYIWFNSVLKVSGLNANTTSTMLFVNQFIDFTVPGAPSAKNPNGGMVFHLAVPDARIIFSPTTSVAQSTTVFNVAKNEWNITVPASGISGNVFLAGLAFKVPTGGLPGGINPVSWSGNLIDNVPNAKVNWQWAAAVYNNFSSDYNALGVKPLDSSTAQYKNSDHAGTPENFTISGILPGGARGGGGSNWTGSYSGTGSVVPTDPPIGSESAERLGGISLHTAAATPSPSVSHGSLRLTNQGGALLVVQPSTAAPAKIGQTQHQIAGRGDQNRHVDLALTADEGAYPWMFISKA